MTGRFRTRRQMADGEPGEKRGTTHRARAGDAHAGREPTAKGHRRRILGHGHRGCLSMLTLTRRHSEG
jgi:hypothetical protein